MKNFIVIAVLGLFIWACGGSETKKTETSEDTDKPVPTVEVSDKGIGEVKDVTLNDPLKEDMIENGRAIYELKCAACHKLTDKRVVGPGWKGVTDKRKPEWIMNMITNVDVMLAEDPQAQALLEECLTRMPNQNVTIEDARDILEFMYWNDQQRGVN